MGNINYIQGDDVLFRAPIVLYTQKSSDSVVDDSDILQIPLLDTVIFSVKKIK